MTRFDTHSRMQRLGFLARRFGFDVLIVAARGDHVGRAFGPSAANSRSRSSMRVHNGGSGDAGT